MQHLTKSLPSSGLKIKHINFPLHLNQRKRYSKDFFLKGPFSKRFGLEASRNLCTEVPWTGGHRDLLQ